MSEQYGRLEWTVHGEQRDEFEIIRADPVIVAHEDMLEITRRVNDPRNYIDGDLLKMCDRKGRRVIYRITGEAIRRGPYTLLVLRWPD